jgi:hypothetical protein
MFESSQLAIARLYERIHSNFISYREEYLHILLYHLTAPKPVLLDTLVIRLILII